jgi:hypothetical protein
LGILDANLSSRGAALHPPSSTLCNELNNPIP